MKAAIIYYFDFYPFHYFYLQYSLHQLYYFKNYHLCV